MITNKIQFYAKNKSIFIWKWINWILSLQKIVDMSDAKKIANYPVNRSNPFNKKKYTSDENNFSLFADNDVKNLVEIKSVNKTEAIDKIVSILGEKLQISKSGLNLFKYIYLNAKYDRDNPQDYDMLPIKIDYKDSMNEMGYTSFQSVYNALLELLEKNIIARTAIEKLYFVNSVFFIPANKINITETYKLVNE